MQFEILITNFEKCGIQGHVKNAIIFSCVDAHSSLAGRLVHWLYLSVSANQLARNYFAVTRTYPQLRALPDHGTRTRTGRPSHIDCK